MQTSARKDVVFGAARVYTVAVPGPNWKSWFAILLRAERCPVDPLFQSTLACGETRDKLWKFLAGEYGQSHPARDF
jgi:hypothetical protein